jgi:hypothetical protein
VFSKEDLIVDSETMRVGNREGLGLMERLDRLERDLRAQKTIIDQLGNESRTQKEINSQTATELRSQKTINDQTANELRAHKRIWCSVRATEIEKNGHYQTKEAKLAGSERNELIHGGDIVADLEVLEFLKIEMPDRYDFTREAFEAWYEVSLQYRDHIAHAPELIIRTFNTLANTKSLLKWSKNRKSQEEAQEICRGIISKWLEYVNAGDGEYPEDDIRRQFEKLVSLKSG